MVNASIPPLDEMIEAEWDEILTACEELWKIPLEIESLSKLELAGVASYLAGIYNGFENIMKQIAVSMGFLPGGGYWHTELLTKCVDHQILSEELRSSLMGWLQLRHFVTHSYGFEIESKRLGEIYLKAPDIVLAFRNALSRFMENELRSGIVLTAP